MKSLALLVTVSFVICSIMLAGCSDAPDPPEQPKLSPSLAGKEAIKTYDKSGDGLLDKEEVASSPGITLSFDSIDTDDDGKISASEITTRVQIWLDGPTIISLQPVVIHLNGRPLEGAKVTMEPEPFLTHAIEDNVSTTDKNGEAYFEGQDAAYPGLYMGFYKVRVSKVVDGKETLPERYNTNTTLGKELCQIGEIEQYLLFELKSD